jgi:molecular chaperone HscB
MTSPGRRIRPATPTPYSAVSRLSSTNIISASSASPSSRHSPPSRLLSTTSTDSPAPETHYDLFPETLPDGPPPQGHFPIDTRALRREFLSLQARYHPDRHHRSSDKTRAEAASALINDAYRTLANPLLRAQYILSLRGVDVANDETLKVEEPDLLMLVLEAREEIEDAQGEEDLEEPRRVNDERIAASEEALDKAFAEDDIETAKREAVRMRYWVNIRDSLNNWEQGKPVVLEH